MRKGIAFFDVDGPLVNGYSNTAFFEFLVGRGEYPKAAWDGVQKTLGDYRAGRISYTDGSPLVIGALARGLEGKSKAEIDEYAREFLPQLEKILQSYSKELLSFLAPHYILASVSASNGEVVGLLGNFGVEVCLSTIYEVKDGFFTGSISRPVITPGQKLEVASAFAASQKIPMADCIAFGDSPSDEMLLDGVGKAFALMPDKDLIELAAGRARWVVIRDAERAVGVIKRELRL